MIANLRYAVRMLVKTPPFTIIATLAVDEDQLNAAPVALLGYDVWKKPFRFPTPAFLAGSSPYEWQTRDCRWRHAERLAFPRDIRSLDAAADHGKENPRAYSTARSDFFSRSGAPMEDVVAECNRNDEI